ncbi:fibrinogen C domain-containing protein 1 [Tribolium castaneum]|uniref:Protein scabrous-like Protein n=1 Tax=Tribolium castaneum TaxID=7070 RepID=D6WEU5_TRICA|nr:PREDICTED: fibrinogen C domain-containing protein 1 [Tribolium castaneum]EFA01317.2 Protein scabrous-like Protein [Tribolium castaneum]|eukprot:XP_008190590.1 PREDICTED: fibrinogen C domain-containing protein 1 [Tribolium castaneum]
MILNVSLFLIFLLAQNVSLETRTTSEKPLSNPASKNASIRIPPITGKLPQRTPRNCLDVKKSGQSASGIFKLKPREDAESFLAFCDMETKGGGWTYFLNRQDGSQNFNLEWEDYKWGFGNLNGEFWMGLQHLYELTGEGGYELLVELEDWAKVKVYARYGLFALGSENEGYSLKVLGRYSGDAGDSLSFSAGSKFSTKDNDQDYASLHCAEVYKGAWWYKDCMRAQLTGQYKKETVGPNEEYLIMFWQSFRGSRYSLKKVKMMVRPFEKKLN